MKKLIFIIIILLILLLITPTEERKLEQKKPKKEKLNNEKKAIFISYIELKKIIDYKDEKASKDNIDKVFQNIKEFNFNMIILQVRSFSDAIYNSKIYPTSSVVVEHEGDELSFDILNYFLKKAKSNKIELHAWINPYRIRNTTDINSISSKNKAYSWINTNNVKILSNGIYYNPASSEVKELIVSGVNEIINNYDIDGIFFDDYFYPSNDIDLDNYEIYHKDHNISLDNYHLMNVNDLVKKVHIITKKNNILFGIGPEGNIENNYNKNYADIYEWGKSNDYVDYLMPQIYYGFKNTTQPFYNVLNEWDNLVKKSNLKIIPALAFYKVGLKDDYAKDGINEWIEDNDIIMRQVLLSRNIKHYGGFGIYRYDFLFNTDTNNIAVMNEIKNLKKVIIK